MEQLLMFREYEVVARSGFLLNKMLVVCIKLPPITKKSISKTFFMEIELTKHIEDCNLSFETREETLNKIHYSFFFVKN